MRNSYPFSGESPHARWQGDRLRPSTSEIQRTLELRLSATAGQEPEVEVGLG